MKKEDPWNLKEEHIPTWGERHCEELRAWGIIVGVMLGALAVGYFIYG